MTRLWIQDGGKVNTEAGVSRSYWIHESSANPADFRPLPGWLRRRHWQRLGRGWRGDALRYPPPPRSGGSVTSSYSDSPPPPFAPAAPVFARLTRPQYANVIRDLFGPGIASHDLEADSQPYLFSVIGGADERGLGARSRSSYSIKGLAYDIPPAIASRRCDPSQNALPCSATTPLKPMRV